MASTTLMSVEEFAALPEDGQMHELVEGELIAMPPPHFVHSRIVSILLRSLNVFLERAPLASAFAEAGFQLFENPPTVRQPDISVVGAARLSAVPAEGYFRGAPDIAIEVLSPSDRADDLRLKVRQYLAAGASAVAVVYPRTREIALHRPADPAEILEIGQTLELQDLLPGWSVPVADVFAGLK